MVLLGRVTGYAGGDAPGILFDKDCNRTALEELNAAAAAAAGSGEAYEERICRGEDWGISTSTRMLSIQKLRRSRSESRSLSGSSCRVALVVRAVATT